MTMPISKGLTFQHNMLIGFISAQFHFDMVLLSEYNFL
jgi:hypothetical protein